MLSPLPGMLRIGYRTRMICRTLSLGLLVDFPLSQLFQQQEKELLVNMALIAKLILGQFHLAKA